MRSLFPRISLDDCKQAFNRWLDHNAGRLGAALSCYALLSLAPLLIFLVALGGVFLGQEGAQRWVMNEARQFLGPSGASAAEGLLKNVQHRSSGLLAGIIGLITLLFGASGVFSELRDGLDTVWDIHQSGGEAIKQYAEGKLFAFGMVVAIGFLLMLSLALSASLTVLVKYFSQIVPVPGAVLLIVNFLVSLYVIAALFALVFKYVPHCRIKWADAWNGALATAILFTVGKTLLGLYLGAASVSSAYGAAGSVVAIVVWVYYSAQIFYYGAEFTWVTAKHHSTQALASK